MLDVCPAVLTRAGAMPKRDTAAVLRSFSYPAEPPSGTCGPDFLLCFTRRQYQNTVESAYGLLPRPPQTPAARFKRLYRK